MLWTAKSCSASRKIRSLRPLAPRRERQARNTSSTVVQSSSVIRVSMVGSSQTDLPSVTDPRTWESTHCILSPIRPHGLGLIPLFPSGSPERHRAEIDTHLCQELGDFVSRSFVPLLRREPPRDHEATSTVEAAPGLLTGIWRH